MTIKEGNERNVWLLMLGGFVNLKVHTLPKWQTLRNLGTAHTAKTLFERLNVHINRAYRSTFLFEASGIITVAKMMDATKKRARRTENDVVCETEPGQEKRNLSDLGVGGEKSC